MLLTKKRRIESPTSILTYLQCPRKYYYRYVKRLEQKPNIHLITGGIAHSTIEAFHNTNITGIGSEGFLAKLQGKIIGKFRQEWQERRRELAKLELSPEEKLVHYDKTREMIKKFYLHHTTKILAHKHYFNLSILEAYQKLKPKTETKVKSERYGVRGVIDAIHNLDGETILIDYKTSKKAELDNNCVIQLAIYTLLHKERYFKMPNKAGIHFLRHGEKIMPTSTQLLMLAKRTCHKIHHLTKHESINKYPRKISGLCKYQTGQCDYYETCRKKVA